jgi:hypothetical protein
MSAQPAYPQLVLVFHSAGDRPRPPRRRHRRQCLLALRPPRRLRLMIHAPQPNTAGQLAAIQPTQHRRDRGQRRCLVGTGMDPGADPHPHRPRSHHRIPNPAQRCTHGAHPRAWHRHVSAPILRWAHPGALIARSGAQPRTYRRAQPGEHFDHVAHQIVGDLSRCSTTTVTIRGSASNRCTVRRAPLIADPTSASTRTTAQPALAAHSLKRATRPVQIIALIMAWTPAQTNPHHRHQPFHSLPLSMSPAVANPCASSATGCHCSQLRNRLS